MNDRLELMGTLEEAALALVATRVGADASFSSVSTDTRTLKPGALFVALAGEKHDGRDYVSTAFANGAVAALVEPRPDLLNSGYPMLLVASSREALKRLAAWWRLRQPTQLIAVVGSNGKTTTKEMIATVLRRAFGEESVLSTAGNLNNEIGVPLTVLRLRSRHRVGVVEIGMNHRGETAQLAELVRPHVGVITNAQREHQAFMTSVEAIAREHADLLSSLPDDGVAVINADDAHFNYWARVAAPRRVLDFGLASAAIATATVTMTPTSGVLQLHLPDGATRTEVHALGKHNMYNALAAAAAAHAIGVSVGTIGDALSGWQPVKGRSQLKRGIGGSVVIDDSYNANPDSIIAAVDALAATSGIKVLVIGDMDEVGTRGPLFHREIGLYARERKIDQLLAIGEATRVATEAFGVKDGHCATIDVLIERIRSLDRSGATILIKGSRFMRMERVVESITQGGISKDRA
jgi:UDP-N-acetylmuramoyl-tripeptide--D-alanyl-D-alanine ligase